MSNNPLASVLEYMLKSEEVFWTYISNDSNIHHAYRACKRLLRVASEAIEERNQRAAKVATLEAEMTTLKEEVKEHQDAKIRMEGALTYVEDQLNTLQAAQTAPAPTAPTPPIVYPTLPATAPASMALGSAPAPASPMPSEYDAPSEPSKQSHVARVIKILDPNQFYADKVKDEITYKDWHLQMLSKMSINASTMPTKAAKRGYVQSHVGSHALAQLKPRLRPNSTNPFVSSEEMFEVLTATFGNANQKQEDRAAY